MRCSSRDRQRAMPPSKCFFQLSVPVSLNSFPWDVPLHGREKHNVQVSPGTGRPCHKAPGEQPPSLCTLPLLFPCNARTVPNSVRSTVLPKARLSPKKQFRKDD